MKKYSVPILVILFICLFLIPTYAQVPYWAAMLTEGQYDTFINGIESYFAGKEVEITLYKGEGYLVISDNNSGIEVYDEFKKAKSEIGLHNLVQICNQYSQDQWSNIIKGHFTKIENMYSFKKEIEDKLDNFDEMKKYISVRIYPESYLEYGNSDTYIYRKDYTGSISALVFDYPYHVANISTKQAEKWGVSRDKLFEIGLANVFKKYNPQIYSENIDQENKIYLLSDYNSVFATSFIYKLADYQELVGKYGSIVSMPHRHIILVYPIERRRNLEKNLMGCMQATNGLFSEGPGSISNNLFWYYDDNVETIEMTNSRLELPEKLIDLVY